MKALFIFLTLVLAISSQVQAKENTWSVIALSEEFGMMEIVRIYSDGAIHIINCETDTGMNNQAWRLTGVWSFTVGSLPTVGAHLADLSRAVDSWETMEWKKKSNTLEDIEHGPPIAVDGPYWRYLLIKWENGRAWVRTINGTADIGSSLGMILHVIEQEKSPQALKSGVVVFDGLLWEDVNDGPPQEVADRTSLNLLKKVGTFIPEPYPYEFQAILQGTDQVSSVEVGGKSFTIWRLRPQNTSD